MVKCTLLTYKKLPYLRLRIDLAIMVLRTFSSLQSFPWRYSKVYEKESQGKVAAVMFNLGYLPGGDHAIVTKPEVPSVL